MLGLTLGLLAAQGLGTPDPDAQPLDWFGAVLAVPASIPLLWRRTAPGLVYAITAAASLALFGLRYSLDIPLGVAVAAYTLAVAYSGDEHGIRRPAAKVAVGAFVPAFAAVYGLSGADVLTIWPEILTWAAIFAGLWIAGDRTRLRGERIADLEEKARQSEREVEQGRRLAAAEERNRIARELHDSAGHAVNVILVQAGAARLLHERNPERSREAISTIEEVARNTIGEIDRIVRALRGREEPEPPAPVGSAAIYELVARHRASGLNVSTDIREEHRIGPHSVAWATYRILQESLTNAARHGCGSADLLVTSGSEAVEITVTNPIGSQQAAGGGHGIDGMRERAMLLGGTFDTQQENGVFRLHAELPLREALR